MANKKIEPRLAAIMHEYINDLVDIGAYGSTPSDVARALIEEGIRRAISQRVIKIRQISKPAKKNIRVFLT